MTSEEMDKQINSYIAWCGWLDFRSASCIIVVVNSETDKTVKRHSHI